MIDKITIIQTIHILEPPTPHPRDCKICSVIQCPEGNPYHLNKYGCPICKPSLKYFCLSCDKRKVNLIDGEENCEICLSKLRNKNKKLSNF